LEALAWAVREKHEEKMRNEVGWAREDGGRCCDASRERLGSKKEKEVRTKEEERDNYSSETGILTVH
jgi:hypothetical protein